MLHEMLGAVETAANPVPLGDTGDRTDVKTTPTGFAVGAAVSGGITPPSRGAGLPSRGAGLPHPASTHKTTQTETTNRFPNSHPSLSDNCKGAA
jgi:hypothetical protein